MKIACSRLQEILQITDPSARQQAALQLIGEASRETTSRCQAPACTPPYDDFFTPQHFDRLIRFRPVNDNQRLQWLKESFLLIRRYEQNLREVLTPEQNATIDSNIDIIFGDDRCINYIIYNLPDMTLREYLDRLDIYLATRTSPQLMYDEAYSGHTSTYDLTQFFYDTRRICVDEILHTHPFVSKALDPAAQEPHLPPKILPPPIYPPW